MIILQEEHRKKLLKMLAFYFPTTKMNICNFKSDYNNYYIRFLREEDAWNDNYIPDSPSIVLGEYQKSYGSKGIGFEKIQTYHWYELVLQRLIPKMYTNENFRIKIIQKKIVQHGVHPL